MAIHLTDKVTMSKTWDAYINTTVLCGQEGFVGWAEDGDLGHCFQDLVLHIPAQVGVEVQMWKIPVSVLVLVDNNELC